MILSTWSDKQEIVVNGVGGGENPSWERLAMTLSSVEPGKVNVTIGTADNSPFSPVNRLELKWSYFEDFSGQENLIVLNHPAQFNSGNATMTYTVEGLANASTVWFTFRWGAPDGSL